MKRMILLLTVAALVVAMLVGNAVPAAAQVEVIVAETQPYSCTKDGRTVERDLDQEGLEIFENDFGWDCEPIQSVPVA